MFDRAVRGLDAGGVLDALEQVEAVARAAEVHRLRLAAHWADLHGELLGRVGPVLAGCERRVRLGGDGTPRVAEFAPAELATTLESSPHAGEALIADALDLRHRLPQLWPAPRPVRSSRGWPARPPRPPDTTRSRSRCRSTR